MKKRKFKLSVIIVNFKSYKYLTGCIQSLKKSNLNKSLFEIIVVDNESNEKNVKLIKNKYPEIIFIINKKNTGFAKANNQAIRNSKGEFILLLNPDTKVDADAFKYLIRFLDSHPQVGIVTGRVELPNGELDDACHRGFPTPLNALFHFIYLDRLFPGTLFFNGYHLGYKNLNNIHEIDSCVGAAMMIRFTVGEQLNWLDEDYFWYGEDLDFCFRAKKNGWKVVFIPDAKIIHFKGVSSGIKKQSRSISSASKKTKLLATKSRYQVMRVFYQKHYADIYPQWLYKLVLAGIKIKEIISMQAIKLTI